MGLLFFSSDVKVFFLCHHHILGMLLILLSASVVNPSVQSEEEKTCSSLRLWVLTVASPCRSRWQYWGRTWTCFLQRKREDGRGVLGEGEDSVLSIILMLNVEVEGLKLSDSPMSYLWDRTSSYSKLCSMASHHAEKQRHKMMSKSTHG